MKLKSNLLSNIIKELTFENSFEMVDFQNINQNWLPFEKLTWKG